MKYSWLVILFNVTAERRRTRAFGCLTVTNSRFRPLVQMAKGPDRRAGDARGCQPSICHAKSGRTLRKQKQETWGKAGISGTSWACLWSLRATDGRARAAGAVSEPVAATETWSDARPAGLPLCRWEWQEISSEEARPRSLTSEESLHDVSEHSYAGAFRDQINTTYSLLHLYLI